MHTCTSILVTDSDRETLQQVLGHVSHNLTHKTFHSQNPSELLPFLHKTPIDILFIDLSISSPFDGKQLLGAIQEKFEHILIIAIIPDGNSDLVKTVLHSNVFFYVKKPYDPAELENALKKALEKLSPNSAKPLSKKATNKTSFYGIIGKSKTMLQLFDLITRVAEDDYSTVLIRGESGTGKELVAKAIHTHSKRRKNNFVPVNCAAIPDDLLESELFGHTKGAFTGAVQNKIGRIQYADRGTLFLDEIGDMKPSLQAKLLRVLQEKEFEPVGALRATPVDTRVLAATHCDLEQLVNEGKFREDLYYRLSVVPLNIPPLKKRQQDIPLLLNSFITRYTEKRGKEKLTFSNDVISVLMQYNWRGNVRELENLVQHMSILYSGKKVELHDLPEKFHTVDTSATTPCLHEPKMSGPSPDQAENVMEHPLNLTHLEWGEGQINFKEIINDFEKQLIVQAMKLAGGNKKEAARILNLKRTTLLEKIKKKELHNLWED